MCPCGLGDFKFKWRFPDEISELEHLLWFSAKYFVKNNNDFQVCGSMGCKCVV